MAWDVDDSRHQRRLMLWASDKVAGQPRPYRIDADRALFANLTRRGDTLVLHLLNSRVPGDDESDAGRRLEPVKPVSGRIRLPEGKRLNTLRTLEGPEPSWKVTNGEIMFELPQVDLYEALVLELG